MLNKRVLALTTKENDYTQALASSGISLVICNTHAEIRHLLENTASADIFDAVVLLANMEENCQSAHYISMSYPGAFIVAMTSGHINPETVALSAAGAGYVLGPDNSAADLLSALIAKWQWQGRYEKNSALVNPDLYDRLSDEIHAGLWSLTDQGWFLQHATGGQLRLTLSEKIVATSLFLAPGHFCSHQALRDAFKDNPRNAPDIRCLFNRLRNHAQEKGLPEPPIVSLRGHGYIWAI